jgi:hypothetical protein
MLSTTVSVERKLDRRRGEKRTETEVVVHGAIARETTNYTALKMSNTSAEHMVALMLFTEVLSKAQLRALRGKGENVKEVQAVVENGRKFDKVSLAVTRKVRRPEGGFEFKVESMDTAYFVDRRDGAIYGVKSPVAPNLNHFYGTLFTVDKWDWTGERAKPVDEEAAGVEAVGGYGEFVHYQPKAKQAEPVVEVAAVA